MLKIVADQSWALACYFEVISWLLPPTSSISKYGSMGKYSTDYLATVIGVRWCAVVGSPTMSAISLCVDTHVQHNSLRHLTLTSPC